MVETQHTQHMYVESLTHYAEEEFRYHYRHMVFRLMARFGVSQDSVDWSKIHSIKEKYIADMRSAIRSFLEGELALRGLGALEPYLHKRGGEVLGFDLTRYFYNHLLGILIYHLSLAAVEVAEIFKQKS